MEFYTVSNFETCMNIFRKYLGESYDLSPGQIENIIVTTARENLYTEMKKLKSLDNFHSYPLKELNNMALNKLRNIVAEQHKLVKPRKPMMRNLARDTNVFGERPISTMHLKPSNTNISNEKEQVNKQFEHLMQERQTELYSQPTQPNLPFATSKEDPIDSSDFDKKLVDIESMRNSYLQDSINIQSFKNELTPKQFYEKLEQEKDKQIEQIPVDPTMRDIINTKQLELIYPTDSKKIDVTKFVTLNGFDRDWTVYKRRFEYQVDVKSFRFRNISSIQLTRLIIPMEIEDLRTLTNVPKNRYQYEFSLGFPYVMVCIDEINNVYEGTNDYIKKSSALFVYDSSFKSPNGRGYVIMKPMQDEIKYYHPTPLASLPSLNVSVRKPNGTLFNNSLDMYKTIKLEYEEYNRMYLKLVLNKYFDKNEFFVGDNVLIQGGSLVIPQGSTSNHPFIQFNEFLNRKEGHEIVEIGNPNAEGYYRYFYIFAPCVLDQETGKLELQQDLVDAMKSAVSGVLNTYEPPDGCPCDAPLPPVPQDTFEIENVTENTNYGVNAGFILNMSLQNTLTMRVIMSQNDPGILNVQNI